MEDKDSTYKDDMSDLIKLIRKTIVSDMANSIIAVQPMPDVDWHGVANSPLWHSFVNRHFKND